MLARCLATSSMKLLVTRCFAVKLKTNDSSYILKLIDSQEFGAGSETEQLFCAMT